MCQSCWTGDHGMPAVATDEVLAAAWLIEHLYVDLDEGTGGPLHDVLDDMNVDGDNDGSISGTSRGQIGAWHGRFDYLWNGTFDRWAQAGHRTTDAHKLEIQHTCEAIIHLFDQMPVSHRAAAIAWAFGWVGAALSDWSAQHRTPEGKERAERDARELLAEVAGWPPPEERYAEKPGPKACAPVPCPPFREVDLTNHYAPLFANGDTVLLADVPPEHRALAEQYIQEHAPVVKPLPGGGFVVEAPDGTVVRARHVRPEELPDADAINRFTEDFLARGGTMIMSSEGRLDLSSPLVGPPLLDNGDGPQYRWSSHYVIHPDGRIEEAHWTAEDVIAAVGFRPSVPGEQITIHATYSAQARRALGKDGGGDG